MVENGDFITFASPIIQSRALAFYFSETQADPANLDTFISAVVQRFSARQLQKNGEGRDTEGQWRYEFIRAAASLLPVDAIIHPENGLEQETQGDFYIAKYKWSLQIPL